MGVHAALGLARRAGLAGPHPSWVAASVGPYGAALADGSEYRGDYGVPDRTLRDFHARRLEVLAAAEPDVLAVETIPDVREAEVLVPLLDDLGIDPSQVGLAAAWTSVVSFTKRPPREQGQIVADEGEDIEVVELRLDDALAMIGDGRIVDGKTIMLLQWWALGC